MSSNALTVFAVDDDEGELELLSRVLEGIPNIDIEIHKYTDPNLALIEFMNHNADLIFLDYQLGEMTAIDLLHQLRRIGDQRPAIVLTGRGDEYAAAELTRAGADDYIIKVDLEVEVLRKAIARALAAYAKRLSEAEVVKHAFELERANEKLEKAKHDLEEMNSRLQDMSDTDPLTGIPNRRYFLGEGEKELARCERNTSTLSLALLDVDDFSEICNRHGKLVGDRVLEKVAATLKLRLRQYDVVTRFDGETFGVLFPECGDRIGPLSGSCCVSVGTPGINGGSHRNHVERRCSVQRDWTDQQARTPDPSRGWGAARGQRGRWQPGRAEQHSLVDGSRLCDESMSDTVLCPVGAGPRRWSPSVRRIEEEDPAPIQVRPFSIRFQ